MARSYKIVDFDPTQDGDNPTCADAYPLESDGFADDKAMEGINKETEEREANG